ncbi:MAG: DUF418 domain-containing protein [Bacteroidales bacterium]|nr:DUF418 domain-containing protein [Bacteroidales bacterium]
MNNYRPSDKPNTRIDVADILRGIAIGGIVLIHFIEHLNLYVFPEASNEFWAAMNKGVWDTTFFLLAGKMYAIFAMLFGLSFYIQHDNQAQKGVDFRPRFAWRMVLLMLFGLFDLLFYNGDILFVYAACGFLVIPFIRASDKVIAWAAVIMLLQPVELAYMIAGAIDPSIAPMDVGIGRYWDLLTYAQTDGSIIDVAKGGILYGLPINFGWALENGRLTQTVCFFLIGILIGRRRLFYNEGNNLVIWKRILTYACIGLVVMLPAYYLLPRATDVPCISHSLNVMLNMWKNFCMMMIIVSGVTLLYYTTSARECLIKIAPYGKMSLTNYLTQSIFGAMLFYNWGFGLYRHCGHTASILMGAAFIVLQYMFCRWWLRSHRRGPFEELWSRATWIGRR